MVVAVLAVMVLTVLAPHDVRAGPAWLLPAVEGVLLIAVIFGDTRALDSLRSLVRDSSADKTRREKALQSLVFT